MDKNSFRFASSSLFCHRFTLTLPKKPSAYAQGVLLASDDETPAYKAGIPRLHAKQKRLR